MMARSTTCFNLRPDTLMQDRRRQFDEIFLQRAAGPYIRVNRVEFDISPACPVRAQSLKWRSSGSARPKRPFSDPAPPCLRQNNPAGTNSLSPSAKPALPSPPVL